MARCALPILALALLALVVARAEAMQLFGRSLLLGHHDEVRCSCLVTHLPCLL